MYDEHKNLLMNDHTVFRAIAHPARREILSLLANSELSVKELTSAFAISQPAVSQHLRALREAKLVTSEKVGLEQRYRLTGMPLKVVFDWSSQYRRFFDPSGHGWKLARIETKTSPRKEARSHGR
jgi:DNA-binding transcriptional ArsR family regulator